MFLALLLSLLLSAKVKSVSIKNCLAAPFSSSRILAGCQGGREMLVEPEFVGVVPSSSPFDVFVNHIVY